MSKKSTTLDERFLIQLYKAAMKNGDPFSEIDYRSLAHALHQQERAIKNIVKLLAQANFIKKVDDSTLYLTRQGCDFALEEMEN